MNKIQQLQKAKSFLEMLVHFIDPTTREAITDSIITKKEIQDTFLYVSTILDEVIKNNGEVIQIIKPIEFQVEKINKREIYLTDESISVITLANRINRQIDINSMQKLKYSKINNWLIKNGYLTKETKKKVIEVQKTELVISDEAKNMGVEYKVDLETGEIKHNIILFPRHIQELIIDNLEEIVDANERKDTN